jgi:hypothetical protein
VGGTCRPRRRGMPATSSSDTGCSMIIVLGECVPRRRQPSRQPSMRAAWLHHC